MRNLALLAIVMLATTLGGDRAQGQSLPGVKKVPGLGGKAPAIPGGKKLPVADCGDVFKTSAGATVKAFIEASEAVDKATLALESSVHDACADMAKALELPDGGKGDTKAVCDRVAAELKSGLKVGVKSKTTVAIKFKPAVCTVNADVTAKAQAECKGSGTTGTGGSSGSAECKASAEARGNVSAKCTEPKVDIVVDSKTVVDAPRIARIEKALKAGLPALLGASARATLVAKSVKAWAGTAGKMSASVKLLGAQAMCVTADLAAAVKASAKVNVRVSVSVQASASVSGSAGGHAQ